MYWGQNPLNNLTTNVSQVVLNKTTKIGLEDQGLINNSECVSPGTSTIHKTLVFKAYFRFFIQNNLTDIG